MTTQRRTFSHSADHCWRWRFFTRCVWHQQTARCHSSQCQGQGEALTPLPFSVGALLPDTLLSIINHADVFYGSLSFSGEAGTLPHAHLRRLTAQPNPGAEEHQVDFIPRRAEVQRQWHSLLLGVELSDRLFG
jgi:hypothetical protein